MPPKRSKRGAPWAAINARKAQLEEARARRQAQALEAAAESARGVLPPTEPAMSAAPIPPPMPARDFNAPPAHGTRAAAARKAVRIFNTTSGPLVRLPFLSFLLRLQLTRLAVRHRRR